MKRKILLLCCIFFATVCTTKAQVTIGSGYTPDTNALLDLKENSAGTSSKGLLLPRVALDSTSSPTPLSVHTLGMIVYNTIETGDVTPGEYYNDGTRWIKIASQSDAATPGFFYMPSILLPIAMTDPEYDTGTETFSIDLYSKYTGQFGLADLGSSVKNPDAGNLPVQNVDDLDFFITYYDNTVFQNVALSNKGILTYKVASPLVITEKTFMNIILKVK